MAFAGGAMVVSAIGAESGDLTAWRFTDGGRTWSAAVTVNDAPHAAREGLHAMVGDAGGHLAAVWLDDRIGPRGKRLWGAFSSDGGATWGKNVMLYESPSASICECCHPSLVALGGGEFVVMWRNSLEGSRDLYAMRLKDGRPASAPAKQGEATWKIDACPMDGGGLAVREGKIVSTWRRGKEIFLAEEGRPEKDLGAGQDVALAAGREGAYVVWSSGGGIVARVPGEEREVRLAESGGFASVAAAPDGGIVVAWEENGRISVGRM